LIEEIAGMRREVLRQTLGVLTDEELAELARLIRLLLERSGGPCKRSSET
jgi:hypothetical protein